MKNVLNFETRSDFPAFLNKCGLTGTGAVVGAQVGNFSEQILNNWKGSTLFSIDAWQNFDAGEYIDIANRTDDQHICFYANTTLRLRPLGERSIV